MTITLRVTVGGQYQATIQHSIDGDAQPATIVGPNSEGLVAFRHGATNDYSITEKYLGDAPATPSAPPTSPDSSTPAT